jgi:hypothetical protein
MHIHAERERERDRETHTHTHTHSENLVDEFCTQLKDLVLSDEI